MHGIFKGEPPRRGRAPGSGRGPKLVIRILLREAALGCVLYAAWGKDPRLNALLCLAVWVALGLTTRRYGLLDRRDGFGWFTECLVVFCGAMVFRNLLVLLPALLADPN